MGFRFWLGIEVKGFRVLMLRGLRFSDLVCYAAGGLGARGSGFTGCFLLAVNSTFQLLGFL